MTSETCCICGATATRQIQTRGLAATNQTLYCDRHAAELLTRAQRAIPSLPETGPFHKYRKLPDAE